MVKLVATSVKITLIFKQYLLKYWSCLKLDNAGTLLPNQFVAVKIENYHTKQLTPLES